MKIHLGCGSRILNGFVNVDSNPEVMPDILWDLTKYPWPFEDNSADEIICVHVIEHLLAQGDAEGFHRFFRECWRILERNGVLKIITPDANSGEAFTDPSHKSFYNKNIFAFISKHSIKENVARNSHMTPVHIDYDFGIGTLNTVNHEIHLEAVANK